MYHGLSVSRVLLYESCDTFLEELENVGLNKTHREQVKRLSDKMTILVCL